MIFSMTAYARHNASYDAGNLIWELRSVNHRYLDLSFRLPELFRDQEPLLREHLKQQLARGKVEISLRYEIATQQQTHSQINPKALAQLNQLLSQLQHSNSALAAANPLDILRWPGIVEESNEQIDVLKGYVADSFTQCLQQLSDSRAREGKALKKAIDTRLLTIARHTKQLQQQVPQLIQAQSLRIRDRFQQLQLEVDQSRLEQELVLLAQKADVDEEIDRLNTHTEEMQRLLIQGGPLGRRLDFLSQELNREANTVASKSISSVATGLAVELKVLIEQIREQVQNIE